MIKQNAKDRERARRMQRAAKRAALERLEARKTVDQKASASLSSFLYTMLEFGCGIYELGRSAGFREALAAVQEAKDRPRRPSTKGKRRKEKA